MDKDLIITFNNLLLYRVNGEKLTKQEHLLMNAVARVTTLELLKYEDYLHEQNYDGKNKGSDTSDTFDDGEDKEETY